MPLTLTAIDTAAQDLLGCVCDGLNRLPGEVPGLAGCPCRSCVVPGEPAADSCGTPCGTVLEPGQYQGQLSVSVARVFSTTRQAFPRESLTVWDRTNCLTALDVTAVDLLVTVYRCAPGPTKDGCPPSCESLSASALQLHADMMAVRSAVQCCYAATVDTDRKGRRFVLGPSVTLGPQGDCVGMQQRVTVGLFDCLPCPAPAA